MFGFSSPLPVLRRGPGSFVLLFGLLMLGWSGMAQSGGSQSTATPAANTSGSGTVSGTAQSNSGKPAGKPTTKHKPTHRTSRASRVAHTARIKQAFVASKELEPMAQQLSTMRTPEAYAA